MVRLVIVCLRARYRQTPRVFPRRRQLTFQPDAADSFAYKLSLTLKESSVRQDFYECALLDSRRHQTQSNAGFAAEGGRTLP